MIEMITEIPETWKLYYNKCHLVGFLKDENYIDEDNKSVELVVYKYWLKRKAYWRYEVDMKDALLYGLNLQKRTKINNE